MDAIASKLLVNRLDKRVKLLRQPNEDESDDYGEPIDELVLVTELWAAIEPLRGTEFFAAQTENVDVTNRIRIRYREDIDRTMTIRYKETDFEILYIIHPEFDKKELQLMCKEKQ